jgi:hypothetical protein
LTWMYYFIPIITRTIDNIVMYNTNDTINVIIDIETYIYIIFIAIMVLLSSYSLNLEGISDE